LGAAVQSNKKIHTQSSFAKGAAEAAPFLIFR
jgi:hypothetical protein